MANKFAETVAQAIANSGMSRRQFAARIGVSHVAVGNWLDGDLPTERNVQAIAETPWVDRDQAWMAWFMDRQERATLSAAPVDRTIPGQFRRLATITLNATGCRTFVPYPACSLVAA